MTLRTRSLLTAGLAAGLMGVALVLLALPDSVPDGASSPARSTALASEPSTAAASEAVSASPPLATEPGEPAAEPSAAETVSASPAAAPVPTPSPFPEIVFAEDSFADGTVVLTVRDNRGLAQDAPPPAIVLHRWTNLEVAEWAQRWPIGVADAIADWKLVTSPTERASAAARLLAAMEKQWASGFFERSTPASQPAVTMPSRQHVAEDGRHVYTFVGLPRGMYAACTAADTDILKEPVRFILSSGEPSVTRSAVCGRGAPVRVDVRDSRGNPLDGATVRAGGWSSPVVLRGTGGGRYIGVGPVGESSRVTAELHGYATGEIGKVLVLDGDLRVLVVTLYRSAALLVTLKAPAGVTDADWLERCQNDLWLDIAAIGGEWSPLRFRGERERGGPVSRFDGLAPGSYRLRLEQGSSRPVATAWHPLDEGEVREVTLTPDPGAAVSVRVVDPEGLAVAGVMVQPRADGELASSGTDFDITDAWGQATLRGFALGKRYRIIVRKRETQTGTFDSSEIAVGYAAAGESVTIQVARTRGTAIVRLVLTSGNDRRIDADNVYYLPSQERPDVAAALLSLFVPSGEVTGVRLSQPAGLVEVRESKRQVQWDDDPNPEWLRTHAHYEIPAGAGTVIFVADEVVYLAGPVDAEPEQKLSLECEVGAPRAIDVRVFVGDQPTLGAVNVTLACIEPYASSLGDKEWSCRAKTGADGAVRFDALPPLLFSVSVAGGSSLPADLRVEGAANIALHAASLATLSGVVRFSNGVVASNVTVRLTAGAKGGHREIAKVATNDAGRYQIVTAFSGPSTLQFAAFDSARGKGAHWTEPVWIAPGECQIHITLKDEANWRVDAREAGTVDVVLVAVCEGKPVADVSLYLVQDNRYSGDRSDVEGRVFCSEVLPGDAEIRTYPYQWTGVPAGRRVTIAAGVSPQTFTVELPRVTYAFKSASAEQTEGRFGVVSLPDSDTPLLNVNQELPLAGSLYLPPGKYWVRIRLNNSPSVVMRVTLPIPLDQPVIVAPPARCRMVVEIAGEWRASHRTVVVTVHLRDDAFEDAERWATLTRASIQREFRDLAPGSYDIYAHVTDHETGAKWGAIVRDVQIEAGRDATIKLTLRELPGAVVRVINADGTPAAGMLVCAVPTADVDRRAMWSRWPSNGVTGQRGEAIVPMMGEGPYTVMVWRADTTNLEPLARIDGVTPNHGESPSATVTLKLP